MDDLTIMCIEKIRKNDPHLRGRRESYWIYTFGTLAPPGGHDESFDNYNSELGVDWNLHDVISVASSVSSKG